MTLGVIRGANEWTGFDVAEAHRHARVAEAVELRRRPVALDRQMHRRRPQVLPDSQDVGALRRDVAHRRDDLFVRLAEADHDPALANQVGRALLGAAKYFERPLVAGLRTDARVQTRDGLDVVVEDL